MHLMWFPTSIQEWLYEEKMYTTEVETIWLNKKMLRNEMSRFQKMVLACTFHHTYQRTLSYLPPKSRLQLNYENQLKKVVKRFSLKNVSFFMWELTQPRIPHLCPRSSSNTHRWPKIGYIERTSKSGLCIKHTLR